MTSNPARQLDLRLRRSVWDATKRTSAVPPPVPGDILLRAQELHAAGAYEDSLALLRSVPEAESDPRALNLAGLCHLGLREHDDALSYFLAADRGFSRLHSGVWVNIAMDLIEKKNYREALRASKRALKLANDWSMPWVNVLTVYGRQSKFEHVDKVLTSMAEQWPEWSEDEELHERLLKDSDLRFVAERPFFKKHPQYQRRIETITQ